MVVSWLADRGRAIFLAVLTGIGLHLAASGIAGDSWETNPTGLRWDRDPSLSEYFPEGVGIELPPTFREKALPVGGVPSGLTPIEGAGDVSTSGGALEFTVVGDRVVLGWGNVGGDLPVEQIESLWPVHNQVALRVRQSCESSTWHAELLADGDELDGEPRLASAVCRGRDWQEVLLESPRPWRPIHGRACPDGMTLTVDAPQGSRIEIESVKAIQPRYEGYVRKEFVLPEGRIWKAVANVGSANERIWHGEPMLGRFYLNGRLVERDIPGGVLFGAQPVDIRHYLRPGANCAGFHGSRIGYPPFLFLDATVIMESGQIVRVRTGTGWRWSETDSEGWSNPGFDDGGWQPAQVGSRTGVRLPDQQRTIPAHAGYLDIRAPDRKFLYYSDREEVTMNVRVPVGLAAAGPVVEYVLAEGTREGAQVELVRGRVGAHETADGSLVFPTDLTRLRDGVYTIAFRLVGRDGTLIDERPRERFVVLRKLDPESVAGTHYTEGLDLELEDVIDFTDPEGSHPWIESLVARARDPAKAVTSPKILRRDGLTYREVTGDKRGSSFSYRLQFRHPGDLYLMELEYPDNANRVMSVSISTKVEHVWSNSQTGVGVETGGKFHTSGTIQKLRWIHAADSGPHSVDIVNQRSGWPAAARSLRIYHITGELPSVGAGNRRAYGIHSERCTPNSGVGMCFGIDGLQAQQRTEDEAEALSLVRRLLRDLFFMKEACENYARYLLFSGQNVHLMGCIQYTPINTPFVPVDPNTRSPRIPNCMRSMLAHVLDLNGIDIIAGVEYSNPGHFRTWANNAQVAKGSDTYWMVDRQGRQRYGRILTQPGNWQHSQFEVGYQRILRDIVRTFGHLAHFRGVSSFSGPSWHPFNYWFPAYGVGRKPEDWERPIVYSYDYITFASFETETGVDLGVDPLDPVRFARRARALEEDPVLRRQFLDWRCRKLRDFIARSVSVLNEGGGRFELFHFFFEETEPFYRYLLDSGRDMADVMRDFAIDLDLIGEIPNVVINRPTISWREQWREFPSQNPYHWMAKEHDAVLSGFRDLPRRSVICRSSWDECYQVAPGHVGRRAACNLVESDWIIDSYRTRVHIQPAGYHAREALLQAIITTDPEIVFNGYTDLSLNLGNEQVLREVMVPYTRLPYRRFEVVLKTGLEANLAIRKLSVADTSWFYVANPGYWRVKGSISLESGGPVFDVVTGERVSEGGMTALPISLDPFGLLAFKVPSPRLEIVSYETGRITDREIAHMMDIIEIVEDLMADPSTPKLAELPAYTPGEKAFMRETASEAREAIANREYAHAWALIKHPRFWPDWREF